MYINKLAFEHSFQFAVVSSVFRFSLFSIVERMTPLPNGKTLKIGYDAEMMYSQR